MKIVMVMVSSINGKITNQNDPNIDSWTSKEDSVHFYSLINNHNLIVMGRKTFEAAKDKIKLEPDKLRIVLTKSPDLYKDQTIPGQLEFSCETTNKLVERLTKSGYKKILLVGGSEINRLFLKYKLVNEIYLTLEPILFGKGNQLLETVKLEQDLKLVDFKILNNKGTLLLHYQVV